ncbi:MAG: hypothetical protein ACKPKO_00165, partial [Candidatus Fonsibacter sp.]
MELSPPHRFVVVGNIIPELRCLMEAGGLVGMNDECVGATQHCCAPQFQYFNWRSGVYVLKTACATACAFSSELVASNTHRMSHGH